uniref:Peptidase S54 rhomboid domain-containing protein n=1 Tax=Tetradesmus obliquus TaxID=3088 RepID=A0A383WNC0_TETOB|eukprot:jgi/Sobl393_1/12364/SZX78226.1
MFDHEDVPEFSWALMEQLYRQGQAQWEQNKRSLLQQVHGSQTFRRTATVMDEALAHLRWSTRILRGDSRVPMPVEWDSRHLVALVELARVLNDLTSSSGAEGAAAFALPPVTAATCLAQLLVFFKPGGVLLRDVSLSPYCVIDKRQYYRLWTAAVVHVDATHLITNLTAVLPDCVMLEQQCGSAALAADVLLLTTTSHALYVAFALLQKSVFVRRYNYYSLVTVGFSGVVFGLKVWAGCKRGGVVYVWGVPVPARFSWVPALALTHLCAPEASFPAHIAGVVAGLLRAYCLEPVLAGVRQGISWSHRRSRGGAGRILQPSAGNLVQQQSSDWRLLHHTRWLQQQQQQQQQQQRTDASHSSSPASSTGGAGPPSQGGSWEPAAAAAETGQQQGSVRSSSGGTSGLSPRAMLLDVGLQLLLAATAAGLYFVLSRGEQSGRASKLRASFWRR